jgi:hypothetical protein
MLERVDKADTHGATLGPVVFGPGSKWALISFRASAEPAKQ